MCNKNDYAMYLVSDFKQMTVMECRKQQQIFEKI